MTRIYSMTGFASVHGSTVAGVEFTLSAKSVNHRFLDLQFRMPSGLDHLEMKLRQMLRLALHRGHVDVTLLVERADESELRVNDDLLDAAVLAFHAALARHNLAGEPDLNVLLRMPGVMTTQRAAASAGLEEAVEGYAQELRDALLFSRAEEGAALASELRNSMHRLQTASEGIGELRHEVRSAQFERLRLRLSELLPGAAVSEDRLLTEAAMLAERSDIEEENVRLQTHVERFVAILDEGGEVGKRLDFLLQELNREANTMLSKMSGAMGENGLRVTEIGLGLKAEIERAREQVQNLE